LAEIVKKNAAKKSEAGKKSSSTKAKIGSKKSKYMIKVQLMRKKQKDQPLYTVTELVATLEINQNMTRAVHHLRKMHLSDKLEAKVRPPR
jgi:hypothetical protein